MVEAVTVERDRTARSKPFVLYILISKFFKTKILRDTLSQNPRWTRISELPGEKNLI
jgi:hypothetical protein